MAPAISVENLVFEYPSKRALHGLSFQIQPGSVTALVGPNGAGKTTLLRCLAALEMPFSGEIKIDGLSTQEDPRAVHKKVAYLPDFFGLYTSLTAKQCLRHMAALHEIPIAQTDARIDEIAEALDLTRLLQSRAGALSRGQRQRLAIAQAILHKPPVLLLDEPAAGLDPEARHSLSQLISNFRQQGMTIVVSSHILSELEDYSSEMLTVNHGNIIAQQKLSELSTNQLNEIELELLQPDASLIDFLKTFSDIKSFSHKESVISFQLAGGHERQAELLAQIINQGFKVISYARRQQSLQDLYLSQVSGTLKGSSQ